MGAATTPAGGTQGQTTILYLLTTDLSTIFLRGQLAAVQRAGFDVHLATRWSPSDPRPVDEGITTWEIPFEREPSIVADLRSLWLCVKLIRRLRPTIVHAGTPKAGLLGMIAAWLTRVPTRLYALHGLRYETERGAKRGVLKWFERVAGACSTLVIADSFSVRNLAEHDRLVRPTKLTVVGHGSSNGVDTDHFQPSSSNTDARVALGLSQFDIVIGFVGRLTHDKGIDDLVEIFRSRFTNRPNVALLLVGPIEASDPITRSTRDRIEQAEQIVYVPWLDDTSGAYRAMDILAFPSFREGLPNVPLEAQSSAVPVIGYAAVGTIDAVANRDLLVDIGDKRALGDLLERAVSDQAFRVAAGASARSWVVDRFDNKSVWAAKIELYERSSEAVAECAPANTRQLRVTREILHRRSSKPT